MAGMFKKLHGWQKHRGTGRGKSLRKSLHPVFKCSKARDRPDVVRVRVVALK